MLKRTLPQWNKSTINLSGSIKVVLFILTLMGHEMSLSLIGMDSMVLCAHLRYSPDYLTPGICHLINPATEKMMSFPAKSSQLFWYYVFGVLQYLTSQDVFVPGPSLRILDSTRCQRTPLCHILLLNLDILQGSFRLCNWLSLRRLVSWINHLPPACWSTFRKSNSKQQLGCRFDIMDYESYFFVFWHMQLYMSWYIISFFGFTLLNILHFFKYSCTNIFL